MKILKRVITLAMIATLMASMAACGKKDNKSETSTKVDETVTTTTAPTEEATKEETKEMTEEEKQFLAENPYGGLVPLDDANDPITFKFFIRDPNQAPAKDNPVIAKIQELTGVTIEWEFLVGDLAQKVGVMIAGEEYPDAIFAEPAKFTEAGAFIPLEDYFPNYPLLASHYGGKQVPKMTAADGHQYILELYGAQENPSPVFQQSIGFWIQKAVLEEAKTIPRTLDEYFKLIEDYKAKYPEIDGVKTIGFEILCDGWRDFCLRNPAQHLMGAGNDGDVFVDLSTMTAQFYQNSDTAFNYYKKLNEEYHKGIIEAETFTQSYDQYISRISTGAVLGFFDQNWNFQSAVNVLKSDGKYNRTYVAVPITNAGVPDGYLDAPNGVITGNNGVGITVNCKNPERLLKFFDWILQREVQDYLQWGVEGVDHTVLENGSKVLTAERRAIMNDTAKKRDLTGDTLWQYCPKRQGLYDDGTPCGPENSADEYLASLSEYDRTFLESFGFKYPAEFMSAPVERPAYYPVWSMTLEEGSAASVSNTKMNDIIRRYYPQLILAEDGEYQALWDEMINEFNSNDLQPYLDEVNRQITVLMSK